MANSASSRPAAPATATIAVTVTPQQVAVVEATIAHYRAGLPNAALLEFPNLHTAFADRARAACRRIASGAMPAGPAPALSVIVPCFKAAGTIERAVHSILAQSGPDVEIVLVDDASPDDTLPALLALAARHAAVTVVARHANGGPAAARNDGIRAARGGILCFLDADDAFAPGFFQAGLAQFAAMPALAAVQTGIDVVGLEPAIDPLRHALLVNSLVTNVLFRRETIALIGGFPETSALRGARGGEDAAVTAILGKYFCRGWDARPLLIHHRRAGSHLDRFLAATRVEHGALVRLTRTPEEASGLLQLAMLMHERSFQRHVIGLAGAAAGMPVARG